MKCPKCGDLPSQGNDYPKLIELAEAGTLVCGCAKCGYTWTPDEAESKAIATNLRAKVASA